MNIDLFWHWPQCRLMSHRPARLLAFLGGNIGFDKRRDWLGHLRQVGHSLLQTLILLLQLLNALLHLLAFPTSLISFPPAGGQFLCQSPILLAQEPVVIPEKLVGLEYAPAIHGPRTLPKKSSWRAPFDNKIPRQRTGTVKSYENWLAPPQSLTKIE